MRCIKFFVTGLLGFLSNCYTYAAEQESVPSLTLKGSIRAEAVREDTKAGDLDKRSVAEGLRVSTATLSASGAYKDFGYVLRLDLRKFGSVSESYSTSAKTEGKGTGNDVDGLSNVVSGAEINRKFGSFLTLSLGRTWLRAGSVENQQYLSWDQYLWSYYADQLEGGELLGQVGTALTATVNIQPDHQIVLQVMNGRRAPGSTQPQGGMTTGATYYGNFFGLFKPVFSYVQHRYSRSKAIFSENGAPQTEVKYDPIYANSLGIGTQVSISDLQIDVEFNQVRINKSKKIIAGKTSEIPAQKYQGGILQLKYSVPSTGISLIAKATSESHELGQDRSFGDVNFNSFGAAMEYWDEPEKLKYFAAYSFKKKIQNSTGDGSNGAALNSDLVSIDTGLYIGAGVKL